MTVLDVIRWATSVPPIYGSPGRVDHAAHHVLLVLATFAGRGKTSVRPSLGTIARRSYLTDRTVEAALRRLVDVGLIAPAGDWNGTRIWDLKITGEPAENGDFDARRERARVNHNERQRRYAANLRDAARQRHLTPSDSVSEPADDAVGQRHLTPRDSVTDAAGQRQMTLSKASSEQVNAGVRAIRRATEGVKREGVTRQRATVRAATPPIDDVEDHFAEFWKTYPRKVGKKAAAAAYAKATATATADAILTGCRRYAEYVTAYQVPADKTCHAATWLNAERWTDEPTPPPRSSTADRPDRITPMSKDEIHAVSLEDFL